LNHKKRKIEMAALTEEQIQMQAKAAWRIMMTDAIKGGPDETHGVAVIDGEIEQEQWFGGQTSVYCRPHSDDDYIVAAVQGGSDWLDDDFSYDEYSDMYLDEELTRYTLDEAIEAWIFWHEDWEPHCLRIEAIAAALRS